MKKTFFIIMFLMLGFAGYSYFSAPDPNGPRGLQAFIFDALHGNTVEIKNDLKNIAPKSAPEKQKEILLDNLKNNVEELKSRIAVDTQEYERLKKDLEETDVIVSDDGEDISAISSKVSSTEAILVSTEKIIEKLNVSNNNQSVGQRISGKVLDIILPVKESSCKN